MTTYDEATTLLRGNGWQPTEDYLCGCNPSILCAGHAEQRAIDHYADPNAWRGWLA